MIASPMGYCKLSPTARSLATAQIVLSYSKHSACICRNKQSLKNGGAIPSLNAIIKLSKKSKKVCQTVS